MDDIAGFPVAALDFQGDWKWTTHDRSYERQSSNAGKVCNMEITEATTLVRHVMDSLLEYINESDHAEEPISVGDFASWLTVEAGEGKFAG